MTYTIDEKSPKFLQARRFAVELEKALRVRGVTKNELGRSSMVGHTAIDHYVHGHILPKMATAEALAEALDWPRLADLVRFARSGTCKNRLCRRPFLNDGGSNKVYCSARCRDVAGKLREANVKARRVARQEAAGETTPGQTIRAIRKNFSGAIREHRERGDELQAAIDAMCRACEPGGTCRDFECPLRAHSPLPLQDRRIRMATPEAILAAERQNRPETRAKRSASMKARHEADPTFRIRSLGKVHAAEAADPELRKARGRAVSAALAVKRAAAGTVPAPPRE